MPEHDDTLITVDLIAMAHGGSALGRHDGKTIFIPYTIPGEQVQAQIVQDRGRVAFAQGVKLLDASGDRVFPRCPHFGPGRCGRCHWQHIDYDAQVLLKQDVLADQLARVGGFDDATIDAALRPIIASQHPWNYNYHMTFAVTANGELAFPGAGDSPPAVIDTCHVLHPALLDLREQLDMDFSGVNRVTLQLDSVGNHMIVLYVDDETNLPELEADFATSVNAVLPGNEPINLIGDSHLQYTVGGHSFRVTVGSAVRSNIGDLPTLITKVVDLLELQPDDAVLDLYAGIGVFGAMIAPAAPLVMVVESYPPAATDADENLKAFDHVDIVEGTVEDVLPTLDELDEAYTKAVIDPPSEGLSIEAVDAIAALPLERLVYVSSDPATLARDAKRLVGHGFRLDVVQPIDLNPQTYFIDAIAVFTRR